MYIGDVETMKAHIVTDTGSVIFMERTEEVTDAEWSMALAKIHLADELIEAAERVVAQWSSRDPADAVRRLSVAIDEISAWGATETSECPSE